jgi:hypothetical protein
MTQLVEVHVKLPDEAVQVWRAVLAEHVGKDVYRIAEQLYERENERWQFEPGETVECGLIESDEGTILAALAPFEGGN